VAQHVRQAGEQLGFALGGLAADLEAALEDSDVRRTFKRALGSEVELPAMFDLVLAAAMDRYPADRPAPPVVHFYAHCIRYREILLLQGSPLLGVAFSTPGANADRLWPFLVFAAVIGVEIDMHPADQIPAELEHVAKAAAGCFAGCPAHAILQYAARRALNGQKVSGGDIHKRVTCVLDALNPLAQPRHDLEDGRTPAPNAKFGKENLGIFSEQIQQSRAARIEPGKILLRNRDSPVLGRYGHADPPSGRLETCG